MKQKLQINDISKTSMQKGQARELGLIPVENTTSTGNKFTSAYKM